MRARLAVAAFLTCLFVTSAPAAGLLVPADRRVPPLAEVSHRVTVNIEDQVAETTVEQVFRNHTSQPQEATYLFPVPRGASVNRFFLWVDGKETAGELLDAKKAHAIYTDIVRRTQDPGLLEYLGNDLLRMRVFPVPARGDARVKLRFTAVAPKDGGLVEYTYPLKTDGKATRTLEDFSVKVHIRSQHAVQSVYSPTHAVRILRRSDREVNVEFENNQSLLDKDFQLFYTAGRSDIGITPVIYKPVSSADGYVMLLVSPQAEAMKTLRVPRDMVLVLDKSGSMTEVKMAQARKALKHVLGNLVAGDRFGIVSFSTTVDTFDDRLQPASPDQLERANKWVDDIRQSGGTAILPALNRALDFRPSDTGRTLTVVFFTDGMPTVDETDPAKIVKAITGRAGGNTRLFTFGVGDDVNAAMLDQLADGTRAVSTYVRPTEDIEVKVSSLHAKISHPVLTDVKLSTSGITISEVYPPQLPDLFHGQQLVVIGKLTGKGPATITLTGRVGGETRQILEEISVPERTTDGKEFVEHLWARRKVGYLLDQIRVNGEQRELVDEVTTLAKKYGIATPYTSWLVVPDAPLPVSAPGRYHAPMGGAGPAAGGYGFGGPAGPIPGGAGQQNATDVAKRAADEARKEAGRPGAPPASGIGGGRGVAQDKKLEEYEKKAAGGEKAAAEALAGKAKKDGTVLQQAQTNYARRNLAGNQTGSQGVDLAVASNQLRNTDRLALTANRAANGRQCVEYDGVWIDEQYKPELPTLAVKSQSDAYFRILDRQPKMKDVYRLGNQVVWVTPNGTALALDPADGKEQLTDEQIDALFVAKK